MVRESLHKKQCDHCGATVWRTGSGRYLTWTAQPCCPAMGLVEKRKYKVRHRPVKP